MKLSVKKITQDFRDMKILEQVNNEAFPENERIEIPELLQLAAEERMDTLAVYDGDDFVGFCSLVIEAPMIYVFFLAVDSRKRSMGYGSKIIALLEKTYSEYQIALDLELIDESAPNNSQRKRRKEFYLRNGFCETGYCLQYNGMLFELLVLGETFDKEKFIHLLEVKKPKNVPAKLFQKSA